MSGVELFDFHELSELSHDAKARAIEALQLGVTRVALVLSAITRRNVQGNLVRFDVVDPREVATNGCDLYDITVAVPVSTGTAVTRQPLGVAVIPRQVVTGMAELLMGGPGEGEQRTPNRFERSLLARRLTEALGPMWEALGLETIEPPGLTYVGSPLAQIPLSTIAIGCSFATASQGWEFTLALSSTVVDAGLALEPKTSGVTMSVAVKDVPVELTVSFSPIKVNAVDIVRLAVGDVIRLEHPQAVPLVVQAQGRPLLLVRHGTTGRRVAIEVLDVLDVAELAEIAAAETPLPALNRRSARTIDEQI